MTTHLRQIANKLMEQNPEGTKTVPCKWCDTPTPMLGTKECDGCWELRTRLVQSKQTILVSMLNVERPDLLVMVKETKDENLPTDKE